MNSHTHTCTHTYHRTVYHHVFPQTVTGTVVLIPHRPWKGKKTLYYVNFKYTFSYCVVVGGQRCHAIKPERKCNWMESMTERNISTCDQFLMAQFQDCFYFWGM